MASITLTLKGTKNPSPIYLRFVESKAIDIITKTGLSIDPKFWDKKARKIRNVLDVPNRDELNSKLARLQITVIDDFNLAYSKGEVIDKQWIDATVSKFFNRPAGEVKKVNLNHHIYLSDFSTWWLQEKAPKFKVKANKYMDKRTIKQYDMAVDNIIDFEGKSKVKLKEVTSELLDDFSEFLTGTMGYTEKTAKRRIGRLKFFCARAEAENIGINKNYKSTVFVKEQDQKYKEPYLNEDEIKRIYKHDFSHNQLLDNVRDNFIIGLRTGLRISDFLTRLKIDNIDGDYIEIKTLKTNHAVSIPLHPQVKAILKKRHGFLPEKISEPKFNKHIKLIGQTVDIDQVMLGGISKIDEKTKVKRKVIGMYKKYLLITSHICRRSFATNLFGKVPNSVIMAVAGWKSESQMLDYVKMTNMENAKLLKKYWDHKS